MNLTPLDVRRKEFDKTFRGYDPTEVDLFLKQVADQLEAVQDEARRAEERTRAMEGKLAHYEKVELALQEALESARETVRRTEASAEEKARLIVQDAELRAERILHDAERERHGLRQDLVRLNARQTEVAARLRGFLLSELEVLAQFQGDDPVGFIKLQSAAPAGALPPAQARLEAPIPEDEPAALDDEADEAPEPVDEHVETAEAPDVPTSPLQPPPAPDAADVTPLNAPLDPAPPGRQMGLDELAPPPTGAYDTAEERPAQPEQEAASSEPEPSTGRPAPTPPPAVTGGWDLRSLVTGEERSVAASDEERERIRRILDDLD